MTAGMHQTSNNTSYSCKTILRPFGFTDHQNLYFPKNRLNNEPIDLYKNKDQLKNPIYKKTSSGGHFGRKDTQNGHFPWEIIDDEILVKLNNF